MICIFIGNVHAVFHERKPVQHNKNPQVHKVDLIKNVQADQTNHKKSTSIKWVVKRKKECTVDGPNCPHILRLDKESVFFKGV